MKPSLIAVAGPLRGAAFPLGEEELCIGRERTNVICLDERSISRRHCVVRSQGTQYEICDLGSANGTHVNSLPVRQRVLQDGDEIQIGRSLFVFSPHGEESVPKPGFLELNEASLAPESTILLPPEDAARLKPENLAPDILLKVATVLPSARGLGEIERRLLELVLEVIPGERGAILLAGKTPEEPEFVFRLGGEGQLSCPRAMTDRILREGVAILSNGLDPQQSLLAVPLVTLGNSVGAILLKRASFSTGSSQRSRKRTVTLSGCICLPPASHCA